MKNVTFTKQVQGLFDEATLDGTITFQIVPEDALFTKIKSSSKDLQIKDSNNNAYTINTNSGKLEKK